MGQRYRQAYTQNMLNKDQEIQKILSKGLADLMKKREDFQQDEVTIQQSVTGY